jgi:hypothetical protein
MRRWPRCSSRSTTRSSSSSPITWRACADRKKAVPQRDRLCRKAYPPCPVGHALARGGQFAEDSPLEGGGFEPSVPLGDCRRSEPLARKQTPGVGTAVPLRRDRWFESGSLHRESVLTSAPPRNRLTTPTWRRYAHGLGREKGRAGENRLLRPFSLSGFSIGLRCSPTSGELPNRLGRVDAASRRRDSTHPAPASPAPSRSCPR